MPLNTPILDLDQTLANLSPEGYRLQAPDNPDTPLAETEFQTVDAPFGFTVADIDDAELPKQVA